MRVFHINAAKEMAGQTIQVLPIDAVAGETLVTWTQRLQDSYDAAVVLKAAEYDARRKSTGRLLWNETTETFYVRTVV